MGKSGERLEQCPYCGSTDTTMVQLRGSLGSGGVTEYFGKCNDCKAQGASSSHYDTAQMAWNSVSILWQATAGKRSKGG